MEKIKNERIFFEETMRMGRREGSEEKILMNKGKNNSSFSTRSSYLYFLNCFAKSYKQMLIICFFIYDIREEEKIIKEVLMHIFN